MKVSIIVPVLDSHEVVRRHILHYESMDVPDEVEIIFMDDGSDPPLKFSSRLKNFCIHATHDTRPWTEHIARNKGVKLCKGEYVVLIDIDYILPKETISQILAFQGDRMDFRRRFGILNKEGKLLHDKESLKPYEIRGRWLRKDYIPGHRSQFTMRKSLFEELGGYREDLYGTVHTMGGGAGQCFWRKWQKMEEEGGTVLHDERPEIFMFPTGKFCRGHNNNPCNLFHNLSRAV